MAKAEVEVVIRADTSRLETALRRVQARIYWLTTLRQRTHFRMLDGDDDA